MYVWSENGMKEMLLFVPDKDGNTVVNRKQGLKRQDRDFKDPQTGGAGDVCLVGSYWRDKKRRQYTLAFFSSCKIVQNPC